MKPFLKTTLLGLAFVFATIGFASIPKIANATYDGGNIIDDATLLNASTMTESGIQNFLISKGGGIANRTFLFDCSATDASEVYYINAGAPCGKVVLASSIIYYASQIYGINPQAVLATLQKEQSLITTTNPTDTQINHAMGYGCPTTGTCVASDFLYQIDNGVWVLRLNTERARGNMTWWFTAIKPWVCNNETNFYKPNLMPYQNVNFYDEDGVYYRTHFIANAATSAFYCYTPHAYNNPAGLYGLPRYGTTGRYYSGSYNFVYYFERWFGSTHAYIYNGTSYSAVFDTKYYMEKYPDIMSAYNGDTGAAFAHFVTYGMKEGRQGSENFDVTSYRNRYQDLRVSFGTNLPSYYLHYINFGRSEGRIATGDYLISYITSKNGIDYSGVYNFSAYISKYSDMKTYFSNDDASAIMHFVNFGMNEGRQASDSFNVISYKNRYTDLRIAFGNNLKLYYLHYINFGRTEGRIATGNVFNGITTQNGIDYSAVYNFNTYIANYSDIKTYFGSDDVAALMHFINFGMNEGRQASDSFNVISYRNRYPDLRAAFGTNLRAYYLHYINFGKNEGRIATP